MLPRYLVLLCCLVYISSCLLLEESTNSRPPTFTSPPICKNNLTNVKLSVDPRLVDSNGLVRDGFNNCFEYKDQLNDQQLRVCSRDKRYLNCFALGMRRAVYMCGRVFANSIWNCTHAVRDLVFGRFVHELDVRERSTVMAMLSAGVMFDLTTCCRERMLYDCSCNYSLPGPYWWKGKNWYGEDILSIKGCSDRLDIPAERTRTLLRIDSGSDNNCDKVDSHNAEVGLKMASVTRVYCRCHGLSASCNIQTCKHQIMSFWYITSKMLMKYSGAVKVHPPTNGMFTPMNESADNSTDEDLVYSQDTPNLCIPNKRLDIPGTLGRRCYPEKQGRGSCDMLCCNKGYYKRSQNVAVYRFRIVNFRIIQEVERYTTVMEYFCN